MIPDKLDYPKPVRYELSDEQREKIRTLAETLTLSETFDMGSYANDCGTPACVAGHIVYQFGDPDQKRALRLGIAHDNAVNLMGWNTPSGIDLASKMFSPSGRLAHYVSTRGEEDYISNIAAAEALERFAATDVFSYDPNLDPNEVV